MDQRIARPAISVCRNPFVKNETKYAQFLGKVNTNGFTTEIEYYTFVNETFFHEPEDHILALNVAPDYEGAVKNVTRIPVAYPYVRMLHYDFVYIGHCAIISFEAIEKYLIEIGEVGPNEKDFTFNALIYLNVSSLNVLHSSYFVITI